MHVFLSFFLSSLGSWNHLEMITRTFGPKCLVRSGKPQKTFKILRFFSSSKCWIKIVNFASAKLQEIFLSPTFIFCCCQCCCSIAAPPFWHLAAVHSNISVFMLFFPVMNCVLKLEEWALSLSCVYLCVCLNGCVSSQTPFFLPGQVREPTSGGIGAAASGYLEAGTWEM